jgi:hypothetical protein
MKIKTIFFVLLVFIFNESIAQNKKDPFKIIPEKNTTTRLSVQFKLTDYIINQVNTSKGKAVIIKSEQSSKVQQKGSPELPKFTRSIIIPKDAEIKVSITESKFKEIKDILIAPSKGILTRDIDPADIPFEFGHQYSKDEMFPGNIYETTEAYILRDFTGQTIILYPFQYNPVKKVLRIYEEMVLEITENTGKGFNSEFTNLQKTDSEFNQVYKQHFLNYSFNPKYTPLEEEGKMLIVCHTNYLGSMQPLVDWKNQRGLKTEMVEFSTIGTTATQLKDYIVNYYNTTGLTYLLLVGDSEHIPSLQKSGDSDAAYGHILGADSYAEVFVGRFSAQSVANVETQVQRTIYYEKEIGTDASWISKAIGIASDEGTAGEGDDGESDRNHMDNIRTDLLNYGYSPVEQIYDPGASASVLATRINEGVGLIDYIGHGSDYSWVTTGFSTTNVGNLTNENMLPFIFDVACVNGNFHNQTCFAESWMRATKNSNPTGAIAIIASTINQSWSSPMDAQDEMIDILTHSYTQNIKRTFGGITVNGIMHMIDEYGSDGSDMANTWTIFGDPSLLVRTKTPTEITISHPSSIVMGNTQLVVTGDDAVFVSLTKENEIIACGEKIENETLSLEFENITEPTTLILTATGYNKVTYVSEINVLNPTTPYVIKDLVEINDSAGNNNNLLEFGEISNLNIQLKNITDSFDAYDVTTIIIATDSNLVLLDSLEAFGTILKDTISLINNAYEIKVSEKIIDQQKTSLTLEVEGKDIEGNIYTWISNINLTLNAPKISIDELLIDDNTGNNNGILDPGETATLKLIVINNGHAAINGMSGLVENLGENNFFNIINATSGIVDIEAESSDTVVFIVTASVDASLGTPVDLKFTITDNNFSFYSTSKNKTITIGKIPEYFISEEGNHTITVNSLFYDSGGDTANYSSNEDYTITFVPSTANKRIKVTFNEFNVEPNGQDCYDYLSIYDGESTSAEKIGDFCSSSAPVEITAQNETGALTFKFISDVYVEESGWEAELSLIDMYSVKFMVASNSVPIENAMITFNNQTNYTDVSGEVVFNNLKQGSSMDYIIRKPGFGNATGTINVTSDLTQEVILTEGTAEYLVEFTVTDGTNAISGATITFDNQQGITDTNGKYIFTEAGYGLNKKFVVSKELYFQHTDSLDVNNNLEIPVALTLEKYSVVFNITSNTNSQSLIGVQVLFNNTVKITGANGTVTFSNITPQDAMPYSITKADYEPITGTLDLAENKTLNIAMSVISAVNDNYSDLISIFPNPTSGLLTIHLSNVANEFGNGTIEITTILGQKILNKTILISENVDEIIDLSDQPDGIYFLQLTLPDGRLFYKKLIVK